MQFDSSYITTAGSELFARATASTSGGTSKPIVWGSVYTSSVDMRAYSPEQIRSLASIPENERSSSGSVTNASHDIVDGNHVAKLECEIRNDQYSGVAYAICVYAKLQGDANEILAAVARVDTGKSDPDTVPESGEYLAIIDFVLTVRDDQLNLLEAPASYYASAQALQNLTNRVVTTHVENSNVVGEDQDVYGVKTFKDDMHTSNVIPSGNFTVDLGDSNYNYRSVSARTVNQFALRCTTTDSQAEKTVISAAAQNFSEPKAGDRVLVKFTSGNSSGIPTIKINNGETYAINGLRTNLEEDSVVPMTFNGSSWDVDGVSSVARQINVALNSEASDYSLVFTDTATRQLFNAPFNRELYIDSNTDGTLKYNPSTNTLTCATFDGEATQLSDDPVLSFTNATLSGTNVLNSTLAVEAGGRTSNTVTINTVGQAYNTFIHASNANTYYSLPFTAFSSTSSFRTLYADSATSSDSLRYNPSTNTLACATFIGTTFSGTATRAAADNNGKSIADNYIVSVDTDRSVNRSTVYTISDRMGTQTNTEYYPHNKYITIVKGSGNKTVTDQTGMMGLISQVIAGSPTQHAVGDSSGVGSLRLVTFKATRSLLYGFTDGCAIPGSIITTASLRTLGYDNENILRVDSSVINDNSGDLSGTWKILHKLGVISSGCCVVALAIRII